MKIARQFTGGKEQNPLPLLPSPTTLWGRGRGWGRLPVPSTKVLGYYPAVPTGRLIE